MHIRHLKELYSVVDLLLTTIDKGDDLSILLKFNGVIARDVEDDESLACHIRVNDAPCKVFAEYSESGIFLSSTTTRTIVKWLSSSKQGNYMRVNSYLSFIDKLDSADITSIEINGEEKVSDFTNEYDNVDLTNLLDYVVSHSKSKDAKINLASDNKCMNMMFTDGIFSRLVKQNDMHTLYINSKDIMNKLTQKFYISGFALCSGVPSINTRIILYEKMAEQNNCKFIMKTAN